MSTRGGARKTPRGRKKQSKTAGRRPGQQLLPEKGRAQTAPAPEEWEYEE